MWNPQRQEKVVWSEGLEPGCLRSNLASATRVILEASLRKVV